MPGSMPGAIDDMDGCPQPAETGAAPPTESAGPRPRPRLPQPRRLPSRGRVVAAAVVACLVAALGLGLSVWPGISGGGPPRAAPETGAAFRTPVPTPPDAAVVSVAWRAALDRLDALRARAFARRRPQLLRQVYATPALRAADRALLERIVPRGCSLRGARTTYDVERVRRSGAASGSIALLTSARLASSRLVCGGVPRGTAPGFGPTQLRIVLTPGPSGLQITAELPAERSGPRHRGGAGVSSFPTPLASPTRGRGG